MRCRPICLLSLLLLRPALAAAADEPADREARLRAQAPLFWADGLDDPAQLDTYQTLGLNTIWVDGAYAAEGASADALALIQAAEERGLKVIVKLPTSLGWLAEGRYRPSPYNATYVEAVGQVIGHLVRLYGQSKAVVGWATEHEADIRIQEGDQDFRAYLRRRFGTAAALSERWGMGVASLDVPSLARLEPDIGTPFGLSAPMLDAADFRCRFRQELLAAWARAIRAADPDRLICTGRLSTPGLLVDVPRDYDLVVVDPLPRADETPAFTSLKGLALARRGGVMAAVATIRPPVPPVFGSAAQHEARARATLAALHDATLNGASGVCFPEWLILRTDAPLHQPIADFLTSGIPARRLAAPPANTAAIIYPPEQPAGAVASEADALIGLFAGGTRYGQLDVLGAGDLAAADLERYGCLLLPQAYFLDDDAQARLQQYVLKGGAILADVGAGVGETGSWLKLPAPLSLLLGVQRVVQAKNAFSFRPRGDDARVVVQYADLPSVPKDAKTMGSAPGPLHPVTFTGWHTLVMPTADARAIAIVESSRDDQGQFQVAGLLARRVGAGLVLYGTLPLWKHWLPECPVFQGLHNDLLRRRGRLQLLDEPGLFPRMATIGMCGEAVWVRHQERRPRVVRLYVQGTDDRAYLGAATQANAEAVAPSGLRLHAGVVAIYAAPSVLAEARPVDLVCEPLVGTCTTIVRTYAKRLVEFELAANNIRLTTDDEGRFQLRAGGPGQVRVTLTDGTYEVEPGSSHEVTIRDTEGAERRLTVTADAQRRLRFTELLRHHVVTFRPAAKPQ